jgi:hypothetical protein
MRAAIIRDKRDYLRADLVHHQNAAEFERFLHQLKAAAFAHSSSRLLIYAHVPRATFKIDKFHASHFLEALAAKPALRVALVATHREVQLVQQYIEALARLKKASLRSFADEAAALAWLATPLSAGKRPKARARRPI